MRGQAFEVFRLLIAAVVAGAVLMVLLNILGVIRPPSTDPGDAIKTLLQKYMETGGGSAQEVEFVPPITVNVKTIAANLGYPEESVCVKSDEVARKLGATSLCNSAGFDCRDDTISYTGRTRRKAKVAVYCAMDVCGGGRSNTMQCAVGVLAR